VNKILVQNAIDNRRVTIICDCSDCNQAGEDRKILAKEILLLQDKLEDAEDTRDALLELRRREEKDD